MVVSNIISKINGQKLHWAIIKDRSMIAIQGILCPPFDDTTMSITSHNWSQELIQPLRSTQVERIEVKTAPFIYMTFINEIPNRSDVN